MSSHPEGFPGPGQRIGPYQIVRQLGMGGMGVVFEAVDTTLNRRVALKVISPQLTSDPAFRVRFTQEAQAQASLDSPHVVQVFAHGEADGSMYIASQLIPDGDLGAMVRASGPPPPGIALDLIAQVAAGLADAHAAGLVHRDIKPANVLLRIRGQEVSAYLADFGIARRTDVDQTAGHTLSTEGFVVGTPSYMAPELHTGGKHGTASDVYSLGCLLWAALVGRAPYAATTDYQLVHAHVSAPVPQLFAAGPFEREVNRILRTAMAKQPGERYPSAAAMRDDLRRVLRTHPAPATVRAGSGEEPVTQHPTPVDPPSYAVYTPEPAPAPYVEEPGPRGGLFIGLGLVMMLLVVGGVVAAVALVSNNDDDPRAGGRRTPAATVSTDGPATDDPRTQAPMTDGPDTESPTAHPTGDSDPGNGGSRDGGPRDKRRAADRIAQALRADADFSTLDADCTARRLVDQYGVAGLQEKGVLDQKLNFVGDLDATADPQLFADIISLGVGCVFESIIPSG